MKSASEVHFRVCDHGLFLPIALRLARQARRVSYWTPHEKAFPTVRDLIGDGFREIERVDSPWQEKDSVDCWVFPDIGFAPMQAELISQGKTVWGARDADSLEIYRGKFLDEIKRLGLPTPNHKVVNGITSLREELRGREDVWVKISRFRGDFETFHWRSWKEDEGTLNGYAVKFGPLRDLITFYVFDPIDTEIEDGSDTWCIDGQFPKTVIHGMEAKDRAYVGTFQKFDELPEALQDVNRRFATSLLQYGYRSFFSTEVRITKDGRSYFIDPTCRAGSPPSQCMTEMVSNYADIIWGGSNGRCVDPEPVKRFGVQAILSLKCDRRDWSVMRVPPELEQWVKCGSCMRLDDVLVFPPEADATSGDVGWLVGIGDTLSEAIDHLRSNVELLPSGAECQFTALADLLKEIESAEENGMEFTDQPIPEPETVLEENT